MSLQPRSVASCSPSSVNNVSGIDAPQRPSLPLKVGQEDLSIDSLVPKLGTPLVADVAKHVPKDASQALIKPEPEPELQNTAPKQPFDEQSPTHNHYLYDLKIGERVNTINTVGELCHLKGVGRRTTVTVDFEGHSPVRLVCIGGVPLNRVGDEIDFDQNPGS